VGGGIAEGGGDPRLVDEGDAAVAEVAVDDGGVGVGGDEGGDDLGGEGALVGAGAAGAGIEVEELSHGRFS